MSSGLNKELREKHAVSVQVAFGIDLSVRSRSGSGSGSVLSTR
jgi:hypothetical protein